MSHSSALLPVRGIVPVANRKGRPIADRDLHRWLRIERARNHVLKCDLLVHGPAPKRLPDLVAMGMGPVDPHQDLPRPAAMIPLSLRTDCPDAPPDGLAELRDLGLLDVFLCPPRPDAAGLPRWLDAAAEAELPIRLQLQPPFAPDFDPIALAARAADAGVRMLNVCRSDPFQPAPPARSPDESRRIAATMCTLARAFHERGIETNLFGLPLCAVDPDLRDHAGGARRFFLDPQQYHAASYRFALALYPRHPAIISIAVAALLAHGASYSAPTDSRLLKWLIDGNKSMTHQALMLISRYIRGLRLLPGTPRPEDRDADDYRAALEAALPIPDADHPVCGACALRRVCDGDTPDLRKRLPGLPIVAVSGDPVASPAVLLARQPKRFDAVDSERTAEPEVLAELAREAHDIMNNAAPARTFGFDDIRPVNAYSMRMPGARRYLALLDRELLSTPLWWEEPPFTASITFGGGLADFIGFAIGDTIRLMCPMLDFAHQLVLHVTADGRYVLLRDGEIVKPTEFRGAALVPWRLPGLIQLRTAMWNVDGALCTQNPVVWQGRPEAAAARERVRFSVIVVCTRYARRLQAVLQSIAHQHDVDPGAIEVIVGYVPGADAVDDLITSMQLTHPDLRILRSPFHQSHLKSKGLIINRSVEMASGDWTVLLDADIVLPPDFFARLGALGNDVHFAAPMGRKMLTRDVTARLLLGDAAPWRDWDALLHGPGEDRYGEQREGGVIPVGFCQCVRTACFEHVPYNEYDHFEGADWEFGRDIIERYGPCVWLDVPVLHLDHGGSQWYGSNAHL